MSATVHECLESGHNYCDALQAAFDQGDRKEFAKWLELQRNWLLVGLRESFAMEANDGTEELSQDDVLQLLAESNARRSTSKKPRARKAGSVRDYTS